MNSVSNNGQKDTVYVDVDDEITAVVDKVQEAPHKIVALVLPKRANVLHSAVNMKLLKRTADESKKNVVLITSESALMPLAGAAGMHVASSLQDKPEIPPPPGTKTQEPESADKPDKPSEDESLEVGDQKKPEPQPDKKPPADKPKKKLKIPNFEKFRTRLILGGIAAVVLIIALVLGLFVLPKATVTLDTDTSNLNINLNFIADTNATTLDSENRILPAKSQEYRVTDSEKAAATGQKNLGNKASGSVSLQNCSKTTGSVTIPKNTRVSSSGSHYRTQSSANLPESSFNGSGDCKTSAKNVSVLAEEPGASHNMSSGKDFSVSGYSDVDGENNSSLTGGTDNVVKIVTQADVDAAMSKIQERASNSAPDELTDQLRGEGYFPLEATLVSGDPTITTSPNVGDEANEVTITSATSYTMVGVKEDDLKSIIKQDADEKIDTGAQTIQNDGLDNATISTRQSGASEGQVPLLLQTDAVAGPNLDQDKFKEEIAGKGEEDIKELLEDRPGINNVEVSFSPFWVNSAPKSTNKITIEVENASNQDN